MLSYLFNGYEKSQKNLRYICFLSNYIGTESDVLQGNGFLSCSSLISDLPQDDGYSLVHLIRACTKFGWRSHGHQLHCHAFRSGLVSDVFISTSLINFYVKLRSLNDADKVFAEIPQPGVVSWNSLMSGYVHSGRFLKAVRLFLQLERSGIRADAFSFTAALRACGQMCKLELGKLIHSKVVKVGVYERNVVVANCLIDMYGKCGSDEEAIWVFNEISDKDTISWNSVIAASARNRKLEQAVSFLHQMPNPDTISYNELISGIAQFGNIDDAVQILWNMPNANSSSWNSIITGYVNRDQARKALEFFGFMHSNGIHRDQFTFSSILSGVGSLSALTWGILIHCCTSKCGLDKSVVVGSALIDMYSKCGQVQKAELIFKSLPEKNLVTWNAMVSGFAHSGNSNKVIELYEQLKMAKDLKPDAITFLNVLSACWHRQTPLEVANQYFESMIKNYGVEAMPEHCASMIRLMGKWGDVQGAKKLIGELGFGSCGLVWRALLGASGTCGDLKVAKLAAAKVIELEGDKEFVYVMMSNIYAAYGKWDDVSMVRQLMRRRGVRKEVGCSWIELDNKVSGCVKEVIVG